jgi:hypothetical protein
MMKYVVKGSPISFPVFGLFEIEPTATAETKLDCSRSNRL